MAGTCSGSRAASEEQSWGGEDDAAWLSHTLTWLHGVEPRKHCAEFPPAALASAPCHLNQHRAVGKAPLDRMQSSSANERIC